MVRLYLVQLFRRAFSAALGLVLASSVYAWIVKIASVAVLLILLYAFVGISPADDEGIFDEALLMVFLSAAAALILTIAIFLAELLIVAPFQLWKEQKVRADAVDAAANETPEQRRDRLYNEHLEREQATIRAKARMMRDRLETRRTSFSDRWPDSHLAAMWDAEQRGEIYDETHKGTFGHTGSKHFV